MSVKILSTLTFIAFVALPGCKQSQDGVPGNLDPLVKTYAELLVLNQRYTLAKDSLSLQQYDTAYGEILRMNNFTRESYFTALQSVSRSPDAFKLFSDRATTKLQEMRAAPNIPTPKSRP